MSLTCVNRQIMQVGELFYYSTLGSCFIQLCLLKSYWHFALLRVVY